jgi:hypothetical protein
MISPAQHVVIAFTALLGGAANSIAGGGMLLTFPALVGLGVPSLVANATSTVALWPGGVASMFGYRAELVGVRRWAMYFLAPSLLGGLTGGVLLTITTQRQFDRIVPFLVLFATFVFLFQRPLLDAVRRRTGYRSPSAVDATSTTPPTILLMGYYFVAVYGGYFGGGAGIIILAALGLMGLTNIHQMNGLKNVFAALFNLVAIGAFVWKGLVDWPIAATMMIGSTAGGFLASHTAQRVPQAWVRASIGVIGFAAAGWMLFGRR